jgi:hypothetical protein
VTEIEVGEDTTEVTTGADVLKRTEIPPPELSLRSVAGITMYRNSLYVCMIYLCKYVFCGACVYMCVYCRACA